MIVHSPHTEADVMLLDTATGRAWQQMTYGNLEGQPEVWLAVPQINDQHDRDNLVRDHPIKASPTQVDYNPPPEQKYGEPWLKYQADNCSLPDGSFKIAGKHIPAPPQGYKATKLKPC